MTTGGQKPLKTGIIGVGVGATQIMPNMEEVVVVDPDEIAAAQHGQQGVRCNAIAPGMIADEKLQEMAPKLVALNTRHNLLPRIGHPDDIASLVAFLASDESSFVTGAPLMMDGGWTAQ